MIPFLMDVFQNELEELIKGSSISVFVIDAYKTLLWLHLENLSFSSPSEFIVWPNFSSFEYCPPNMSSVSKNC